MLRWEEEGMLVQVEGTRSNDTYDNELNEDENDMQERKLK